MKALLLLICLAAFSPVSPTYARPQAPRSVALTPALLDKVEKVSALLSSDSGVMDEWKAVNRHHDDDYLTDADHDAFVARKYPRLTAADATVGFKPHEFYEAVSTLLLVEQFDWVKASHDPIFSPGNINFARANAARIRAVREVVFLQDP